ncbi:MAG: sugar phosphate isomerase/epimerase family protein [Promethearchaeota archaeon]
MPEFLRFSKNFSGVELKYEVLKTFIEFNMKLKEILELLNIFNLSVVSIFSLKNATLCSESYYKVHIVENLNQIITFCNKLECDLLLIQPSILKSISEIENIPKWRIIERTRKKIKEISKIAYKNDINVALEIIHEPTSSIQTISDAIDVIQPLESQENVGYVIDTFHFAKSTEDISQIYKIKEFLYLIQLSDLIYKDYEDIQYLKESDRIFPGEGNFNFNIFLKHMERIGYRKYYSLKLSKKKCSEDIYNRILAIF